ncbi:MAG TPA: hypothetical protein VJB35_01985 [Candidatus Nanoarchaeia archaeon]|nr:hypothetical protein [Candidatus Nanoarchaeia archaeon]
MTIKQTLGAIILVGAIGLTGCKEIKTEVSNVLHEDAIVITKIYTPSRHDTDIELKAMNLMEEEEGFGSVSMDYDGDFGIGIGNGLQISSSEVPEKYGVVFKCQHGTFTSQGSDERHKELYRKLQDNQGVDVTYKEIYRTTYDKNDLVERVLTGFDFLDANPKKE